MVLTGVAPVLRTRIARRIAPANPEAALIRYPTPLSLRGALLLGRIFSPWNIVAYAIGIGMARLRAQLQVEPARGRSLNVTIPAEAWEDARDVNFSYLVPSALKAVALFS